VRSDLQYKTFEVSVSGIEHRMNRLAQRPVLGIADDPVTHHKLSGPVCLAEGHQTFSMVAEGPVLIVRKLASVFKLGNILPGHHQVIGSMDGSERSADRILSMSMIQIDSARPPLTSHS
jgi:hypothetical protein